MLRNLNKLILVFGLSLLCLIWSGVYYQIDNERQAELRSAIRDTANMARAFEEHTLRTINSAANCADGGATLPCVWLPCAWTVCAEAMCCRSCASNSR